MAGTRLLSSKLAAPVDLSGAAAPAPLSEGEPRSCLKLLWRSFRLWQERSGANLRCSLGPFAKGAVSEADWGIADEGMDFSESFKRSGIARVGFLSVSVRKTSIAAQSLSHGCAVPAPFTREPRLQWCFMASKGRNRREFALPQKAPLCKRSCRRRRLRNCRT